MYHSDKAPVVHMYLTSKAACGEKELAEVTSIEDALSHDHII